MDKIDKAATRQDKMDKSVFIARSAFIARRAFIARSAFVLSLLLALALAGCNSGYAPWVDPDAIDASSPSNTSDIYTGRPEGVPHMRGVNCFSYDFYPDYLDTLANWNINLIRWNMLSNLTSYTNVNTYLNMLDQEIAVLDRWLPELAARGIYVSICMMELPGGREGGNNGSLVCSQKDYEDAFVEGWRRIAAHFAKDVHPQSKYVWAYELANEPGNPDGYADPSLPKWQPLCRMAGKAIRGEDPVTTIIFPPNAWQDPVEFETFDPSDLPNVIYTEHMYEPFAFTHQGLSEDNKPMTYPNENYNKEVLRAYMKKRFVDFAQKNRVHYFVGEFGVVCWSVGAAEWIRDVTELMEEYDLDWTFFSFSLGYIGDHLINFGATHYRESPSAPAIPADGRTPQARELINWYELNQH
jgi:hypothetical protein